ncbi:MAG: ABC transporter ATP-binding protein [Phycisphaerales bacterium]
MIHTKNLTVRYGQLLALNALSLDIAPGEVFGFIGPNGAGKSTTMKVLSCLLRPTSGHASVNGLDVTNTAYAEAIRRTVGYMPDFLGVYDDLTVSEYLQFFAAAFSIPRKQRSSLVDQLLELTDLTAKKDALVDSLSRGMQQRLGVARVLVHDPKVLLLDEPASGLDPRARIEMRSLLKELAAMGKTIVLSSHILSELHEMCSSIGIIERGELLYAGTIAEAFKRAEASERIRIAFRGDPERALSAFEGDDRISSAVLQESALLLDLAPGEHGHQFIFERLISAQIQIDAFIPQETKLEDVFIRLTKGSVQ